MCDRYNGLNKLRSLGRLYDCTFLRRSQRDYRVELEINNDELSRFAVICGLKLGFLKFLFW